MSIIFLSIGSLMTVMFVFFLIKGQRYNYMVDTLEGSDYPFKMIYTAGLAMQDFKVFSLRTKIGSRLRENTKMIFSRKYAEYYARIIWAQALSLGLLLGGVMFMLAGIFEDMSVFLGLIGLCATVLPGYYFISHSNDVVKNRSEECDRELPNAISKLALMVNSGVILHDAWRVVSKSSTGQFYDLMRKACNEMDNGNSDIDAIHEFGVASGSDVVKKFSAALIQSIERAGDDLPIFLSNQSKELWSHRRQTMLQKGEKAAGALLMPIAIMFLGVMLIVMVAAMQSFSF